MTTHRKSRKKSSSKKFEVSEQCQQILKNGVQCSRNAKYEAKTLMLCPQHYKQVMKASDHEQIAEEPTITMDVEEPSNEEEYLLVIDIPEHVIVPV